ncbi:hypothetical protein GCM10009665_61520 [Kitasatospora nipponensis]|uniref:Uncharacterized protein n=1 Tax=Kitasatospora nipponensis TaxID=258049 RepID=A0ABN1WSN9_9ACTN
MGLFNRKSNQSDTPYQHQVEQRYQAAHDHYRELHQARQEAFSAAARAADHGTCLDIVNSHIELEKADGAMWEALAKSGRIADERHKR